MSVPSSLIASQLVLCALWHSVLVVVKQEVTIAQFKAAILRLDIYRYVESSIHFHKASGSLLHIYRNVDPAPAFQGRRVHRHVHPRDAAPAVALEVSDVARVAGEELDKALLETELCD